MRVEVAFRSVDARRVLAAATAMTALAGCAEDRRPVATLDQVIIASEDLERNASVTNGYVSLASDGTIDLFPCPLAVARVEPAARRGGEAMQLKLSLSPVNQVTDWCELFVDLPFISEVFPTTYPGSRERIVTAEELVDRAEAGGARLCLVYSIKEPAASYSEVRGALYDVRDASLLATLHADAQVVVPSDHAPPPAPPDRLEVDRRHVNARLVAMQRFREFVRQCVMELEASDHPASRERDAARTASDRPVHPAPPGAYRNP